jgi:hypothetical protein
VTCAIPGMCSRSPACKDKHCEGHPINSRLHRAFAVSDEEADYPPTTPEEAESWVLALAVSLAVFAFACFCAVAFLGAPLSFPFN